MHMNTDNSSWMLILFHMICTCFSCSWIACFQSFFLSFIMFFLWWIDASQLVLGNLEKEKSVGYQKKGGWFYIWFSFHRRGKMWEKGFAPLWISLGFRNKMEGKWSEHKIQLISFYFFNYIKVIVPSIPTTLEQQCRNDGKSQQRTRVSPSSHTHAHMHVHNGGMGKQMS